jgi:hypothetical protein
MIVQVKESDDGDLYIELPDDMIKELGWAEGTEVVWVDNENGTWSLVTGKDE